MIQFCRYGMRYIYVLIDQESIGRIFNILLAIIPNMAAKSYQ